MGTFVVNMLNLSVMKTTCTPLDKRNLSFEFCCCLCTFLTFFQLLERANNGWWFFESAIPLLMLDGVPSENVPYVWGARGLLAVIAIGLILMVKYAWDKNGDRYGT